MRELDGRAIPRQSAERRRRANRAAGIRPNRGNRRTLLHTSGRAARRTASEAARIVGLHTIPVVGIFSRDAVRELVQMRLANDDRAKRAQTCREGGVFAGNSVACGVETRAGAGGEAGEIEAILERDWQAVERRLRVRSELARQRVGFAQHGVRVERQVHVAASVAIGTRERPFGGRTRRDLTANECVAKSLHRRECRRGG